MSEAQTLLLGLIAGGTIVLGLPIGRLRSPRPGLAAVPERAGDRDPAVPRLGRARRTPSSPSTMRSGKLHDGSGGMGPVLGYGALFLAGISVGPAQPGVLRAVAGTGREGAGASGQGRRPSGELSATRAGDRRVVTGAAAVPADRRGIGLHNFGEGLAIGASAAPAPSGSRRSSSSASPCTTRPRDSASSLRWRLRETGHRGASCC